MIQIMGSVGRGGNNMMADVKSVQNLLNQGLSAVGGFQRLAVDGISGPKTIGAIELFQRQVLGWMTVDGRVDPNGKTLQSLNQRASQMPSMPTPPAAPAGPTTEPKWMRFAKAEIGVKEIKGSQHNPRVVEYHATTGKFGDDETAWCSSFVNWVMLQAGYTGTNSAVATSWSKWGQKVDKPAYGAIAVIDWDGPGPGWQGHVGFVVGKVGNFVQLLGGNQSDAVNVKNFGTSKIIAYVFPANYTVPADAYDLEEVGVDGQSLGMAGTR